MLIRVPYREKEDLPRLSSLGYFLASSSALLGWAKMRENCANIAHYGQMRNEADTQDMGDEKICLAAVMMSSEKVKQEISWIERFIQDVLGSRDS
jgi:osomolarity two-component system phosphorelay intermediate protein YPD1